MNKGESIWETSAVRQQNLLRETQGNQKTLKFCNPLLRSEERGQSVPESLLLEFHCSTVGHGMGIMRETSGVLVIINRAECSVSSQGTGILNLFRSRKCENAKVRKKVTNGLKIQFSASPYSS